MGENEKNTVFLVKYDGAMSDKMGRNKIVHMRNILTENRQ